MHTRKKIVFAINNLGMGGAENMLVEQVRCVDRDLFDPYVITLLKNQKVNVIDKLPKDIKFIQFDFTLDTSKVKPTLALKLKILELVFNVFLSCLCI